MRASRAVDGEARTITFHRARVGGKAPAGRGGGGLLGRKSVGGVYTITSGRGADRVVYGQGENSQEAAAGREDEGQWRLSCCQLRAAGRQPGPPVLLEDPPLIPVCLCRYKDYREPPWSEHKYDISKDFWAVLAARLAFVIVFQVWQALVSGRFEKRALSKCSEPRTGSEGQSWPTSGALGDLEAWQPWVPVQGHVLGRQREGLGQHWWWDLDLFGEDRVSLIRVVFIEGDGEEGRPSSASHHLCVEKTPGGQDQHRQEEGRGVPADSSPWPGARAPSFVWSLGRGRAKNSGQRDSQWTRLETGDQPGARSNYSPRAGGGILSHVGPATVHLCTPHIWNPRDWIQAPALPFTESVAAGRLPPPEALLPHLQLSITLCSGNKHLGLSLPEAEPETRILCKWVIEGSCPGERRESNRGGVSAGDSLT